MLLYVQLTFIDWGKTVTVKCLVHPCALKAKVFEWPCCCVTIDAIRTELLCSVARAEICKSIQLPQTPPRSMVVFLPLGELNISSCISSDTVFQEINSAFIFILMSQAMYRFLIGKQWERKRAKESVKGMEGSIKCEKKENSQFLLWKWLLCQKRSPRPNFPWLQAQG